MVIFANRPKKKKIGKSENKTIKRFVCGAKMKVKDKQQKPAGFMGNLYLHSR